MKIHQILLTNPFLRKLIETDLGNYHAIARFIINQYKLDVSIDSIVSAIRRFAKFKGKKRVDTIPKSVLSGSVLQSNFGLTKFIIKVSARELAKKLSTIQIINIRLKIGVRMCSIYVDQVSKDLVQKLFSDKILDKKTSLVEILITTNTDSIVKKGIGSVIIQEVAINSIPIEDTLFSPPEFAIYVNETDATKALEILSDLVKMKKSTGKRKILA